MFCFRGRDEDNGAAVEKQGRGWASTTNLTVVEPPKKDAFSTGKVSIVLSFLPPTQKDLCSNNKIDKINPNVWLPVWGIVALVKRLDF